MQVRSNTDGTQLYTKLSGITDREDIRSTYSTLQSMTAREHYEHGRETEKTAAYGGLCQQIASSQHAFLRKPWNEDRLSSELDGHRHFPTQVILWQNQPSGTYTLKELNRDKIMDAPIFEK